MIEEDKIIITIRKKTPEQIKVDKLLKQGYCIDVPLPYDSTAPLKQSITKQLDTDEHFGRAGIIPYSIIDGDIFLFFNLFKGRDRTKAVIELSDFGGRSEPGESFIRSACYETLEESLGIFNFLGKEDIIRTNSYASYSQDRAIISLLVPVQLHCSHLELVTQYSKRKEAINGPLEEECKLPSKNSVKRDVLFREYDFKLPTLVASEEGISTNKDKMIRSNRFNANECANIVYIKLGDLKKLLTTRRCIMPHELFLITGERYPYYPKIYFAIAEHVAKFISFLEK